jgi:hypothetical protein
MQGIAYRSAAHKRAIHGCLRVFACLFAAALLAAAWATAQEKPASEWDTTQARGKTRDIDFDTSEGTWMSLDVSLTASGSSLTSSDTSIAYLPPVEKPHA